MKKANRILVALLSLTMGLGIVGCGDDNSGKTTIKVVAYEGGYGYNWVKESAQRFQDLNETTSFEKGKTGVYVDIKITKDTDVETMNSSAVDIYFTNGNAAPRDYSQKGWLVDINDIVTEKIDTRDGLEYSIADKIDEDYRVLLQNRGDGHYYGLPYADYYSGLTYDEEAFTAKKLYFAAPDATSKATYNSAYGTANFLTEENATSRKSCGIDGKYGTADDGLPTSLRELMILCAKIKQSGYVPFAFPGGHANYTSLFFEGLWASLAGYEKIRAGYDFTGTVDIVEGYEVEPLFPGINYIRKPKIKTVPISEAEGYYSTQTVERYYALSFIQICQKEGWFAQLTNDGNVSNTATMGRFLTNGLTSQEKVAMLIEGSYWYNEADDYGEVKKYQILKEKQTGEKNAERKVAWMPLPVSVNETVEERTDGGRNRYTFTQSGSSFAFINARTKNKGGVLDACKAFLQFTYTDAELSKRVGMHGVYCTALSHPVADEDSKKLNYFQRSVFEAAENADLVLPSASNATFLAARTTLSISGKRYLQPIDTDGKEYTTIISAIRSGGLTAEEIMKVTMVKAADWGAYYQG